MSTKNVYRPSWEPDQHDVVSCVYQMGLKVCPFVENYPFHVESPMLNKHTVLLCHLSTLKLDSIRVAWVLKPNLVQLRYCKTKSFHTAGIKKKKKIFVGVFTDFGLIIVTIFVPRLQSQHDDRVSIFKVEDPRESLRFESRCIEFIG